MQRLGGDSLVTMLVKGNDSWMFQIPGTHLVEQQAELCSCSWLGSFYKVLLKMEVDDLKSALSKPLDIDGIVSGALKSDYQKTRLERMCEDLESNHSLHYWHQSSDSHMDNLVQNGFKVMITGVSSEGLEKNG